MRKARVPVYPRCTWPCDSLDARGAELHQDSTALPAPLGVFCGTDLRLIVATDEEDSQNHT